MHMVVSYLSRLVAGSPPRRLGFDPALGHVGFVVDEVTLQQMFSECCILIWNSGVRTVGLRVAGVANRHDLTQPRELIICVSIIALSHRLDSTTDNVVFISSRRSTQEF
jgi:hypothetical protein